MSNINRLDNSFDDDDDNNMDTTTNQIYSPGCIAISSQQPTPLAQSVTDERSNDLDPMTDGNTDEQTAYQVHAHRSSILVNGPGIPTGESWPWTEDSVWNYVFAANRDEHSNDRIAHPSDTLESILNYLLHPIFIHFVVNLVWNSIPLGIPDTQPHTIELPHASPARQDIIVINENGDNNEDGTLLNDTDDAMENENMNSIVNHERENQMIVTESTGTEVADELTNTVNLTISTDARDDGYTNINNENGQIMECDTTAETEHKEDLQDEHNARGQASPRRENIDNHEVLNNAQSNIPTIGSAEEATEIQPLVAGPANNNNRTSNDSEHILVTSTDVLQLNAHNRKQSRPLDSTAEEINS